MEHLYRLPKDEKEILLELIETGMVYQILKSDEFKDEVVTSNSEFVQYANINSVRLNIDVNSISLEEEAVKKGLQKQIDVEPIVFNKYEQPDPQSESPFNTIIKSLAFLYNTRQGDEFRRLSAFRKDNRVFKDGSLRKRSYGTTILDLASATSGVSVVGRYALPNRLAACYVFQIIPPPGTKVLFGTVTPNFGLCSGGVEVCFPDGCAEGSVRFIGTIPEF